MSKPPDTKRRLTYPEASPSLEEVRNDLTVYHNVKASEAKGWLTSDKQLALLKGADYWYRQWSGSCGRYLLEAYRLTALRDGRNDTLVAVLALREELASEPPFYHKGYLLGHPSIPNDAIEAGIPRCGDARGAYGALLAHVQAEHQRLCRRFREAPPEEDCVPGDEVPDTKSGLDRMVERHQARMFASVALNLKDL